MVRLGFNLAVSLLILLLFTLAIPSGSRPRPPQRHRRKGEQIIRNRYNLTNLRKDRQDRNGQLRNGRQAPAPPPPMPPRPPPPSPPARASLTYETMLSHCLAYCLKKVKPGTEGPFEVYCGSREHDQTWNCPGHCPLGCDHYCEYGTHMSCPQLPFIPTAAPDPNVDLEEEEEDSNVVLIIIIVLGVIVVLGLIYACYKKRRRLQEMVGYDPTEVAESQTEVHNRLERSASMSSHHISWADNHTHQGSKDWNYKSQTSMGTLRSHSSTSAHRRFSEEDDDGDGEESESSMSSKHRHHGRHKRQRNMARSRGRDINRYK